jgi:TonB-dependent receptor
MSNWILRCFLASLLICLLLPAGTAFAAGGTISGVVRDSQTGDALPGANVMLVKTSLGASTDVDGRFTIRDIPAGSYTLRATYVGYKDKEVSVQVREDQAIKQDFKLLAVGVEGEEVVVTAQAAGQKAAINQQISAMPIVNIVSRARIQELPDANAAESVSRLPGVSLIRTGGEGSKVVIRGLSPQYNQVTIDGVELPSNVTSSNVITGGAGSGGDLSVSGSSLGDRGEDLSMISSSMLDGIEVIKAITPDMDATLIGGVVNFGLRKAQRTQVAPEGSTESAAPMVELRAQGGYTQLKNSYDNFRGVASVEKRFFDDQRFGVFVQGSDEKRNLSSNNLGASYTLYTKLAPPNSDVPYPEITGLTLNDVFRKRQRYGGTIVMDYQHDKGEIDLMNFISTQTTQEITRGENLQPKSDDLYYNAAEANNKLSVMSNLLAVKHDFNFMRADLKVSHSYTESNNPEDLSFNFWQHGAGFGSLGDVTKIDPKTLDTKVVHDQTRAGNASLSTSETVSKERTIQGSLDLTKDISLSTELSSRIKIGGVFQHRTREFDYNTSSGSQLYSGGGNIVNAWVSAYPWLILSGGRLGLENFTTDSYQYGEFLNGDYSLAYPMNVNLMWSLLPIAKKTTSTEGYRVNVLGSDINDYSGYENKSAGYAMVVLDYGPTMSLIPGVRYQDLTTKYTAMRGMLVTGGLQGGDTTVTHSHGYWLPMVHARYRPFEWMQIHFAYTNTLNYPDYSTLTPRYLISQNSIDYNNHSIKPATSENFDLVVSVLSNEIGLLSINGFKKKIKDLVFFSQTYTSDLSKFPELPQGGKQLYAFNTYINNPNAVDLWGIESEWQTHFWYLPKPFDGLVLNVNYTHIFSEAKYPRTTKNVFYDDEGNSVTVVSDTFYTTRMLNQPNDIVNLAMGYDLGGFSVRVSMLYQDNIFKNPDFWFQQRVYSAKFTRWDLSVKQDLPWFGMQVFFNINNLNGEDDIDLNAKNLYPANEQRYGMSADLGFVVRL